MATACPLLTWVFAEQPSSYVDWSVLIWYYDGRPISYRIPIDVLTASRQWSDPDSQPPPLPIKEAVTISKRELSKYVPAAAGWSLRQVAIVRAEWPERWYYVVTWRLVGSDDRHELLIPVLMNGTPAPLSWEKDNRKKE